MNTHKLKPNSCVLKTAFAILAIALFLPASNLTAGEQVHIKRSKANFEMPNGWLKGETDVRNTFVMNHPEGIASINIRSFYYLEAPTINAFQMRRVANEYDGWMNLTDAACFLGVCPKTLRRAIERGAIDGEHPLPDGPWVLNKKNLDGDKASKVVRRARMRVSNPAGPNPDQADLEFPST